MQSLMLSNYENKNVDAMIRKNGGILLDTNMRVISGIDCPVITQINSLGILWGKDYPSEACACQDLGEIFW